MTSSRPQNPDVDTYIESLPPERQDIINQLRAEIHRNLDAGFEEMHDFGMIVYAVPLERYPITYNKKPLMYAALASQKRYVSLYLMGIYADEENAQWFADEYRATGKRLDMGKSCVRFRTVEDIPLELIGNAIARDTVDSYIARVDDQLGSLRKSKRR